MPSDLPQLAAGLSGQLNGGGSTPFSRVSSGPMVLLGLLVLLLAVARHSRCWAPVMAPCHQHKIQFMGWRRGGEISYLPSLSVLQHRGLHCQQQSTIQTQHTLTVPDLKRGLVILRQKGLTRTGFRIMNWMI